MKISSSSVTVGDEFQLKIERIVPNGFGIGFAEGLTIFTPLTAPGDCVRARLTQVRKKIAFAEVVEVIEPSPARVAPPCKYFGICGGCDFQQMGYAAQLEAKVGIVRDCLKRIGHIDWQGEIAVIGSPNEFQYRSRAHWHLDPASKKFGYLKRNSHEVIDVDSCPKLVPELEETLTRLRNGISWENYWDDSGIRASAGDKGQVSVYSSELLERVHEITSTVAGDRFIYSAETFFQGNRYMIEKLVETAIADTDGETSLDLYSGVGLFALPLARKFTKVIAVEDHEKAVDFAVRNAENARLDNIEFKAASVKTFLAGFSEKPDLILLDPPRSGAEPETIQRLAKLQAREISYVSCEPSILARDLSVFIDNDYSISSITVLDLFPQTHHVETVMHLKQENS